MVVVVLLMWMALTRPVLFGGNENAVPLDTSFTSIELRGHVQKLSEEFKPRSFSHPDNLNRTADYIATLFRTYGAAVEEQPFKVDSIQYKNIVAEFGPEDAPLIVIGAHYDAAGLHPGADDNASGVAGLLQLGRLLSMEELTSRVVLVAFTLEEPPFFATEEMGSAVFARSLAKKEEAVQLMISLEMIGYFSDESGSQSFPFKFMELFYPTTGNFIAIVDTVFSTRAAAIKAKMNQVISVPVYSINAPSFVPGIDYSDHRNFWHYGYPAVMVTDTAYYRNYTYHTPEDTADRLDYDRMAEVVYGVFSYVLQLNNNRSQR